MPSSVQCNPMTQKCWLLHHWEREDKEAMTQALAAHMRARPQVVEHAMVDKIVKVLPEVLPPPNLSPPRPKKPKAPRRIKNA